MHSIDAQQGENRRIGFFNITVTSTEEVRNDVIILIVTATSEKAKKLGKTVEAKETLTVKILRTEEPGKDKSSTQELLWIFLLIAAIIIFLIIILFIILRRKKRSKEELPTSETVTIKPMPSSELEKPHEQVPAKPPVPQLPGTAPKGGTEKATAPTSTDEPKLPGSTPKIPGATPQQITEIEQKPMLPAKGEQKTPNKDSM